MVPWRSAGDVLRWWRSDVLGLTQQEAADRLNIQSSSLSNWERGTRAISIELDHVDRMLDGNGVLKGLLWASSTPEGLEPGHLWSKVFPGPSTPVWLWLRSPSTVLVLEAEWGLVRLEAPLELGPNGAFVTVGASVADSPAVIHLSEPGWADFGSGELPAVVPGATMITAVSDFMPSTADGRFMELFQTSLRAKLVGRSRDVVNLAAAAPKSVFDFVTGRGGATPTTDRLTPWPPDPEGIGEVRRHRFAMLREARRLSRIDVAQRLSDVTGVDVSRDTLRRFETDVGQPHDPMLAVALDYVLGAEGRLAVLEIRSGSGPGSVTFPPYWRGPIWLALEGGGSGTMVKMQRGNWQRELRFKDEALVSLHWFDPAVPLRLTLDESVDWTVGVGRLAGAEPVDQNWEPTSVDIAQQAVSEAQEAIFKAVEHRPDDTDP